MACVAFIDDQVGTVLDALEASSHADDTIVILTSDHGFHVGDKESIYKQTLWDSGTRIPLIISGLEGMPQNVICKKPVSLIDIYPTFIDFCELPEDPHQGRSGYPLDGHSIKPLILNPKADWAGPNVAITALPGKDHSQHREHIGTLYPHFSVRSEDWRYSLTSDGQEELYHYPNDPYEFTNLANKREFADIQAELKKQLIELRDGPLWAEVDALPENKLSGFELMAEVKGESIIHLGEIEVAKIITKQRASVRIRAAGNRCQVWMNNRVYADEIFDQALAPGKITSSNKNLRDIRIRKL